MKIFIILTSLLVVAGGFLLFVKKNTEKYLQDSTISPSIQPINPYPQEETTDKSVDIKASFTVITDSVVRSFRSFKYHNQSVDVFISSDNPTQVHVKKKGITWNDFFQTLPMRLTKECLITGDGETFCDGKKGTLKFYLNDKENKDLLDKEIQNGAKIIIKFTVTEFPLGGWEHK